MALTKDLLQEYNIRAHASLKKIGYQGSITFESFSSEVVDANLSNTLCVWRNLWHDSDDLARTALQFMQERY